MRRIDVHTRIRFWGNRGGLPRSNVHRLVRAAMSELVTWAKVAEKLYADINAKMPPRCQNCGSANTFFSSRSMFDGNEIECRDCHFWVNIGGTGFRA